MFFQPYVVMKDLQTGVENLWPKAKFINRKYVMDEMYENFEDGDDWQLEDEKDPFTETPDIESLIGCVGVPMQSLGYVVRMRITLNKSIIADWKIFISSLLFVMLLNLLQFPKLRQDVVIFFSA